MPEANPWVTEDRLRQQGGMIVWDIDDPGRAAPEEWKQRFPNSVFLEPLECKTRALTGDVLARVGVMLVHPQKQRIADSSLDGELH